MAKIENLSPEAYTKAYDFLRKIRKHQYTLTRQQMQTLRGQALHGDIEGAEKGLGKILLGGRERETSR